MVREAPRWNDSHIGLWQRGLKVGLSIAPEITGELRRELVRAGERKEAARRTAKADAAPRRTVVTCIECAAVGVVSHLFIRYLMPVREASWREGTAYVTVKLECRRCKAKPTLTLTTDEAAAL